MQEGAYLALAAPQVAEPDSVVSGNSLEKLMVELAAANAEKEWKQAAQEFQKDWVFWRRIRTCISTSRRRIRRG